MAIITEKKEGQLAPVWPTFQSGSFGYDDERWQ